MGSGIKIGLYVIGFCLDAIFAELLAREAQVPFASSCPVLEKLACVSIENLTLSLEEETFLSRCIVDSAAYNGILRYV